MAESTEGKPMYVESLLTRDEWGRCRKKYPTTYNGQSHDEAHEPKPNPFKWRKGMGERLSSEEIGRINKRIDFLKENAKKLETR